MKITLTGYVRDVERGGGITVLQLATNGKVEGEGPNGRDASAEVELRIMDRFANKLGLGDKYTVTIVAEPAKE